MQLKKLEIQGFKSFADKTEIVFLDGITTIVGPNGSGKSNISDAVRWVIGEQSVKTLRGSKMEDVIFAGTQVRKKVGFAEVSMYLDNSDATLPVDFKEVVVTRRVYRTGESNYLINGTECRLKDIQELFMDTGVGRDGYSIISQGKIDEILSSKSEERRHIFEEASGIVKYRTRKEEAQKKLDNTHVTLSRVGDILSEIENTIGPLEKRAEVAKKYLSLRDELKVLDVRLFIDSLQQNAQNLAQLDDIIETFSRDIELEEMTSVELEKAKLNLKERFQEITLKIEETQKKYFEIENEAEKLNSRINVLNTEIANDNVNIVRLKEEITQDSEKIELLKQEVEKRLAKKISLAENKLTFETQLKEKEAKLSELMLNLDSRGLEIENLKKNIDVQNEEKYDLKVQNSSMLATIEANEKQMEEKAKSENKSIAQKDSVNAQKDDIYLHLSQYTSELKEIANREETIQKEYDEKNSQLEKSMANETRLKQEIMTLQSKYQYLLNLDNENEGYYRSVKSALDFAKTNQMPTVYGTIASLISTEEQYEYAIEIALGGYLQNVVVEKEEEAKSIISYLKQNMLGRVTFLPLNGIKKVSSDNKKLSFEGVIGFASDLVKYQAKYKEAVTLALNNTVVVDTIDHAIDIAKKTKNQYKIVTLQGELIASTGSITGGQTSHKSAGLIGRQEKIAELKKQIESKEKEYHSFHENLATVKMIIKELSEKLEHLKVKKDELNIQVATFNEKYESIKREIEKIEHSKDNTEKILQMLKSENESLKVQISANEERIVAIEQSMTHQQEEIDEYVRFNREKQKEIDFINEDIMNLKVSLSSFDESVSSLDEMKEKIEQDITNFETGITRKKEQIELLNNNIQNAKEEIDTTHAKISDYSNDKINYQELSQKLKIDKDDILKKQDALEVKMLESVRKIEKLKDEKAKIETKKVKFDLEIENLKNKMWDEYELTLSSAKQLLEGYPVTELSIKEIAKKADKIRKEIKDLGEVNLSSIQEYQTTKERYDFILGQREDLEQTKAKLQNLINNMTAIMKTQFSKQFQLITENFNETFKELFGGGKAELRLSDEANVLESGIEIEVQPPGKKLQSMMLLSGGERALTAIALLFAILKLKSPPFCILDEIEAALDDVNVARFADYIKTYSNNTQFIVITHRKGTMEVASSVYGVTMQEYGISKIISMKLKS